MLLLQVAPAELEALLCTHNAVQDVAVIGERAGEDIGEVPKAFIVTKPGISITQQELHNFVDGKLFFVFGILKEQY